MFRNFVEFTVGATATDYLDERKYPTYINGHSPGTMDLGFLKPGNFGSEIVFPC